MTLSAFQTKLSQLDVEKAAIDAVSATTETIADLNAEQMFKGLRADGSEITPGYSELTKEIKRAKGQPIDRVTLFQTGAFYRGLYASVTGLNIVIGSTDAKSGKLERKYSKAKGSIFGLSGKYNAEYIRETLRPAFGVVVKRQLK